jgi:hypothetical protein
MVSHLAEPLMEQQRSEEAVRYKSKLERREITFADETKTYYRAQRCDNRSGGKGVGNEISSLANIHQ